MTTALLESAEGETKVYTRTGYRTRDLWLLSQTRNRLRYAVRLTVDVKQQHNNNQKNKQRVGDMCESGENVDSEVEDGDKEEREEEGETGSAEKV